MAKQMSWKDPSVYVKAQPGQWLYLNCDFEQWKNYSKQVSALMPPQDLSQLLDKFQRDPPRLGTPAALDYLNLNEPLQVFLQGLILTDNNIAGAVVASVKDNATPFKERYALLGIFDQAEPTGYMDTLKEMITDKDMDSEIRWEAIRKFGAAHTMADLDFLTAALEMNQGGDQKISQALVDCQQFIRERIQADDAGLVTVQDELVVKLDDNETSSLEQYAAILTYVRELQRCGTQKIDSHVVRRSLGVLEDFEPQTANQAKSKADAVYVLRNSM